MAIKSNDLAIKSQRTIDCHFKVDDCHKRYTDG